MEYSPDFHLAPGQALPGKEVRYFGTLYTGSQNRSSYLFLLGCACGLARRKIWANPANDFPSILITAVLISYKAGGYSPGEVPQHPPIISAPISIIRFICLAKSSAPMEYTGQPLSSITGIPAFGFTIKGITDLLSAYFPLRTKAGPVLWSN